MSAPPFDEKEIFNTARQISSGDARAAWLEHACAGYPEQLARIRGLLAAHEQIHSFLEPPDGIQQATQDQPLLEHPGVQIGPYRLMEQIGEGGMGLVFVAEQHEPVRRKVALKVIKPGMDTRACIARFEAERQALALMDHPNIARVLDAGETTSGRPYFVMELVKGVPITDYCDANRLTPRERLMLFTQVCHAVQHAHLKGIIHRDIKPTNVLVASHDGQPVVKVIDFGVAKAIGQQLTERTLYTAMTQMVGTPLYMSPEQAGLSSLDIDTRTDIYSLGVLLYELLTGTTPFDKERLKQAAYDEMRRIIREEEPQKPSTWLSELSRVGRVFESRQSNRNVVEKGGTRGLVPPYTPTSSLASVAACRHTEPAKLTKLVRGELDWIVMKALEKDRNRRYETANGFAADVLRYLSDEPVQACPPSARYRLRKFAARNKAALATATLISAALVAALVVLAISNTLIRRESQAKEVALGERDRALGTARHQEALAKQNAAHAEVQRGIAQSNERTAEAQTLLARRRFYASQMNLAMQAWRAGEVPRVLELLEGQRPAPDEEDLRGFEWYYLWRLCNGGHRLYLHGHTGAVLSLSFSPDGTRLASASWDRTVRLWDTATGRELRVLRGHDRGAWRVTFSPDGKTLASSGQETGTVILWDARTGKALHTFVGSVDGMAFSSDSKVLAGGVISETGTHVKLWDAVTGVERATLADAGDVVGLLPDDKTLVTLLRRYSAESEIQFWDLHTGQRRSTIPLPRLHAAALSHDGRRLAASSVRNPRAVVTIWDTATGQQVTALAGQLSGLTFSPDAKRLACVGGRTVTLWEVETARRLGEEVHLDPAGSVSFSPDGKMLASSTLGGAIKLWDMTPAEEATIISTGATAVLQFSADQRTLLVGNSGPTKLIDVAAGQETAVLPAKSVLAISSDANVLAGAGADQSTIWDVRGGREIATLPLPRSPASVPGHTLSPDGKLLAVFYAWNRGGYGDTTVKLWNLATHQPKTLKVDPPEGGRVSVLCAEFSPDGKLLAAGYQFQWVTVWDVATGRVKLQISQPAMTCVFSLAFSPDNQALAVGTNAGAVTLWEVETGKRIASFKGHASCINSLAFSSDGKTLATAGDDQTVRLWDVLTGQERNTLAGHKGAVRKVQFSSDGNILATAGDDGTIKLWRSATDPQALARRTALDSDDPSYQIAYSVYSSAWALATAIDPEQRNPTRAVELAQKAISLAPRAGHYWLALGIAQYGVGQWQDAIATLNKSEELAPGKFTGYVASVQAMASWKLGHKDEAQQSYQRATQWIAQHAPNNQQLHRFHVEAAELLGLPVPPSSPPLVPNATDVETALRQAVRLRPNESDSRLQLGQFLRQQGNFGEAESCFREVVRLNPQLVSGHFELGRSLLDQKKPEEAIDCFRTCLVLNPRSTSTFSTLGFTFLAQKKWDEAVEMFRQAVTLDPSHGNLQFGLGRALMEQKKQPQEAIATLRRSIQLDPKRFDSHYWLGLLLRQQHQFDEALASFRKALELNPQNAIIHDQLGSILAIQGKTEDGIAFLRKAIELNPKLASSHAALAKYLATAADPKVRDPKAAVRHARTAIDLQPAQPHHWRNLGVALLQEGDNQAAVEALEEARKLRNGGDAFEWFFLAMAHWHLDEKEEARKWNKQAVEWMDKNEPENEELRRIRAEAAELLDHEKNTE